MKLKLAADCYTSWASCLGYHYKYPTKVILFLCLTGYHGVKTSCA